MICVSALFALLAPDSSWTSSALVLLQGATLVCALWTSGVVRMTSRPSRALFAIALGVALLNLLTSGQATTAAAALFAAVLTVAVVAAIGLGVLDQGEVNRESVRGAIGIYILFGLLFSFLYGAVAVLGSGTFFAQGTDGTRALRTYFSYVTLATLGYGDYTPAGTIGHALAVVEAIVGQIYLVTVVSLLIARFRVRRAVDEPEDDPPLLIPPG
jgi:hypothetical protein